MAEDVTQENAPDTATAPAESPPEAAGATSAPKLPPSAEVAPPAPEQGTQKADTANLPTGNPIVPPGDVFPRDAKNPVTPPPGENTFPSQKEPPPSEAKKSDDISTVPGAAEENAPLAPVLPFSAGRTPTPPQEAANGPLAPVVPISQNMPSEQQVKALAALNELAQHPEAASAMLSSPDKAAEYFGHLAALNGKDIEKTKEDFALKLQQFLKAKEEEFAPQKQQMDALQKQAGEIEKQGKELTEKGKSAQRKAIPATIIGTIALGIAGFFAGKSIKGSAAEAKTWVKWVSTLVGAGVGAVVSAWGSGQIFAKPLNKKFVELQDQHQKMATQAQQTQQQVGNQLKPAINQFIASYISDAVAAYSQGSAVAPAPSAEPAAIMQDTAAPAKQSAIAGILANGPTASFAARAEEAAGAAIGGRA